MTHLSSATRLISGVLAAGLLMACGHAQSTLTMDPETIDWTSYTDTTLNYTLDIPASFRADADSPGQVLFRHHGVPVLVRFTDEDAGRRSGAWFGHPADGPISLSGHQGLRYVYRHHDGPFSTGTVAYVVPYKDRYLGLEFRTEGDLDAVQRRILESFSLP